MDRAASRACGAHLGATPGAPLRLVLPLTNTYLVGMRLSPSKALAVVLVLVFCAFGAEQASAASKKQPLDGSSVPNIMVDEGTPIIMQGLERPKRASQGRRDTSKETERKTTERHIKIPRGSAGFVPPPSRRVGSRVRPCWGRRRLPLRTTRLPSATPASGLVNSISLFNLTRAWGTIPPTATPTCATISTDNRSRGVIQPIAGPLPS